MRNALLGTKCITKGQMTWKDPGSVLGQDSQQVLVKHDSHVLCVHSCRLTIEGTPIMLQSKNEGTQETQQSGPENNNNSKPKKAKYSI